MVGSITVIGALARCVLFHSVSDLKFTHMNAQESLVREFTLYNFKLCQDTAEATKNNRCGKGEGTVGHSTGTKSFKIFSWVARSSTIRKTQVEMCCIVVRKRYTVKLS